MSKDMVIEQVDLRRNTQELRLRTEEIVRRQSHLLNLGFQQEWISSLMEKCPTLYDPIVIDNYILGLQERGFLNPIKMITSEPATLGYAFENINDKIAGLKKRGFLNPNKMIESSPAILGYAFENINDKIAGLKKRGFLNPIKMITLLPTILGLAFENIDQKLAGLKERGFLNPIKMVTTLPTILSYTFENIDDKIAGLKKRGFLNPIKMITLLPAILCLAFENIDDKIAGLKKRGFLNPNKMIESSPAILGYAFKNIDRRIELLSRLIHLYRVPLTAQGLMENQNGLFSSKIDKIVVLARVLRKTAQSPKEVRNSVIDRFLFSNLEDVLIAVDMLGDDEIVSSNELLIWVKKIKAAGFTKDEKRIAIEQGLRNDSKIRSRYLKGYPKKE